MGNTTTSGNTVPRKCFNFYVISMPKVSSKRILPRSLDELYWMNFPKFQGPSKKISCPICSTYFYCNGGSRCPLSPVRSDDEFSKLDIKAIISSEILFSTATE